MGHVTSSSQLYEAIGQVIVCLCVYVFKAFTITYENKDIITTSTS